MDAFPYWYPWWDWGYGYGYYPNGYYDGYYDDGSGAAPGYNYDDKSGPHGSSLNSSVQEALARDGYYHGQIDGVMGTRTRSAIRNYERANGLPVDGLVDRQLLRRMGIG